MSEKTTKTLQLNFQNTEGKNTRIVLKEPEKSVDAENVKRVMDHFVQTKDFQDEAGDLYAVGVNAEEIVRVTKDVYSYASA